MPSGGRTCSCSAVAEDGAEPCSSLCKEGDSRSRGDKRVRHFMPTFSYQLDKPTVSSAASGRLCSWGKASRTQAPTGERGEPADGTRCVRTGSPRILVRAWQRSPQPGNGNSLNGV